jgi:hypothetical protein
MEPRQRIIFHIVYGVLLVLVGVGLFFRIPQVMPKVATMASYKSSLPLIRIFLYLLGCFLIGGGIKKIHFNYKQLTFYNKKDVSG